MKIFREAGKLRKWCEGRRSSGETIALVPTMGCLHDGHMSLVEEAKRKGAGEIVVSVFVNPVQFGPKEDYAKYPRTEKADLAKLRAAGVAAVFLPSPAAMYAPDHSTYVEETALSKGLCGAKRPGHFRGVCTVVAKLFNIVRPDFAVFGRKDYQQAQVIKRMVRDLDFGVRIVVAPIVRERDGLAMSSRNGYLSESERTAALAISRSLSTARPGIRTVDECRRIADEIRKSGLKVDYVEVVDAETLERVARTSPGDCILAAAYAGKTRLIDNMQIKHRAKVPAAG